MNISGAYFCASSSRGAATPDSIIMFSRSVLYSSVMMMSGTSPEFSIMISCVSSSATGVMTLQLTPVWAVMFCATGSDQSADHQFMLTYTSSVTGEVFSSQLLGSVGPHWVAARALPADRSSVRARSIARIFLMEIPPFYFFRRSEEIGVWKAEVTLSAHRPSCPG